MPDPANLPHERTLASDRAFDGHLLHVRVDQVSLPSGRHSQREVVEHPGSVAIVALTARDELILVRQWRYSIQSELLEIPAGTREPGESPVITAARELREETGYLARELREIATLFPTAGYSTEQMHVFLAASCQRGDRDESGDERTEVVLVPRSELTRLLQPGEHQIRDAKTAIGLLWLLANPASPTG